MLSCSRAVWSVVRDCACASLALEPSRYLGSASASLHKTVPKDAARKLRFRDPRLFIPFSVVGGTFGGSTQYPLAVGLPSRANGLPEAVGLLLDTAHALSDWSGIAGWRYQPYRHVAVCLRRTPIGSDLVTLPTEFVGMANGAQLLGRRFGVHRSGGPKVGSSNLPSPTSKNRQVRRGRWADRVERRAVAQ